MVFFGKTRALTIRTKGAKIPPNLENIELIPIDPTRRPVGMSSTGSKYTIANAAEMPLMVRHAKWRHRKVGKPKKSKKKKRKKRNPRLVYHFKGMIEAGFCVVVENINTNKKKGGSACFNGHLFFKDDTY